MVMGSMHEDPLISRESGALGKILLGLFKLRGLNEDLIKPKKGDEAISSLK